MTEIQAILGIDQVRSFPLEFEKRQRHTEILARDLEGLDVEMATVRENDLHGYFKFPLLLPKEHRSIQERVVEALVAEGALADPAHPCLGTIDWIQEATSSLCRRFGVVEVPDNTSASTPVAADYLPRTICLEVGHSIDDSAVVASADALRKVLRNLGELIGPEGTV